MFGLTSQVSLLLTMLLYCISDKFHGSSIMHMTSLHHVGYSYCMRLRYSIAQIPSYPQADTAQANSMWMFSGKLMFLHTNLSPKWSLEVPAEFAYYNRRWQVRA